MKTRYAFFLGLTALLVAACSNGSSTSLEQNKAVVRQMIAAINARDLDALDSLVAPGIVRHSQATPNVMVGNLDEFKAFLEQDIATIPDSHQEIVSMIAEEDRVAVMATLRGTQSGPFGDLPATDKPVDLRFLGMLRIEDGKVAEIWVEWDNLSVLTQLGLFPPAVD